MLELPVAEDLEGRVLVEALSPPLRDRPTRRVATFGPREIDDSELPEDPDAGDRIALLRRLGYLGGEDENGSETTAGEETSTQTLQEAYNRGFALLFAGDLDGAEQAFRRLESLAPGTGLSDLGLGEVALRRGDVATARDRFEAAVRARPGDPVARLDLGLARLSLGDLEQAEKDLRAVLALDDRRFLALRGMGEIELRRGRPAHALEHLERATKVAASELRRADAEYLRGTALLRLGRKSEAETCFLETLAHRPDHPEALFRVAQFALEGGRPGEAASALERLVALRPDDDDLRRLWSQALLEAGREEEARAVLSGRASPGP
jgi:tetratricopeptide (TPR) repeat protein